MIAVWEIAVALYCAFCLLVSLLNFEYVNGVPLVGLIGTQILIFCLWGFDYANSRRRALMSVAVVATLVFCVLIHLFQNRLAILGAGMLYLPIVIMIMKWASCLENHLCHKTDDGGRPFEMLGRKRFYERLHLWIRKNDGMESTGKALAIVGEWGSGKSHLIKYLSYMLSKKYDEQDDDARVYRDKYIVCDIKLWAFQGTTSEVWKYISDTILCSICVTYRFLKGSGKMAPLVENFLSIFQLKDIILSKSLKALFSTVDLKKINEIVSVFEQFFSEGYSNKKVVVVFDDFERLDREVLMKLIPIMERIKRVSGVVIVCAIAKEVLEKRFSDNSILGGDVSDYLDKIFDLKFNIPPLKEKEQEFMIKYVMQKYYSDAPILKTFILNFSFEFHTPREIERVMSRIYSIEWRYFSDSSLKQADLRVHGYLAAFVSFLVEIIRSYSPEKLKLFINSIESGDSLDCVMPDAPKYILDCCAHLKRWFNVDEIHRAYNMEYTLKKTLNAGELYGIYFSAQQNPKFNLRMCLTSIFKKNAIPDDMLHVCEEFVSYCLYDDNEIPLSLRLKCLYALIKNEYKRPSVDNAEISNFIQSSVLSELLVFNETSTKENEHNLTVMIDCIIDNLSFSQAASRLAVIYDSIQDPNSYHRILRGFSQVYYDPNNDKTENRISLIDKLVDRLIKTLVYNIADTQICDVFGEYSENAIFRENLYPRLSSFLKNEICPGRIFERLLSLLQRYVRHIKGGMALGNLPEAKVYVVAVSCMKIFFDAIRFQQCERFAIPCNYRQVENELLACGCLIDLMVSKSPVLSEQKILELEHCLKQIKEKMEDSQKS